MVSPTKTKEIKTTKKTNEWLRWEGRRYDEPITEQDAKAKRELGELLNVKQKNEWKLLDEAYVRAQRDVNSLGITGEAKITLIKILTVSWYIYGYTEIGKRSAKKLLDAYKKDKLFSSVVDAAPQYIKPTVQKIYDDYTKGFISSRILPIVPQPQSAVQDRSKVETKEPREESKAHQAKSKQAEEPAEESKTSQPWPKQTEPTSQLELRKEQKVDTLENFSQGDKPQQSNVPNPFEEILSQETKSPEPLKKVIPVGWGYIENLGSTTKENNNRKFGANRISPTPHTHEGIDLYPGKDGVLLTAPDYKGTEDPSRQYIINSSEVYAALPEGVTEAKVVCIKLAEDGQSDPGGNIVYVVAKARLPKFDKKGRNIIHDKDGNVVYEETYVGLVYMHLETIDVKVGDDLKPGSIIGKVGHSGHGVKKDHLHFEVHKITKGEYNDCSNEAKKLKGRNRGGSAFSKNPRDPSACINSGSIGLPLAFKPTNLCSLADYYEKQLAEQNQSQSDTLGNNNP